MAIVNIALSSLGAEVVQQSSAVEDQGGQNVLHDEKQMIWRTEPGLPQSIVIDLRKVSLEYSNIVEIGFECWHDYQTNPSQIELYARRNNKQPFQYWQVFSLAKSSKAQFFSIKNLHQSFKLLKFRVIQAHGADQTYLNQVFIHAKTIESPPHSDQLAVEDLHSPMKISFPRSKSNSHIYLPPQPSSQPQLLPYQTRGQYLAGEEEDDEDLEEVQQYSPSKSDLRILVDNMAQMQDNLQEIRRNVEVLDLKVQVATESIGKKLSKQLKGMVKQEMEKVKNQLRQELGLERGRLDLKQVRSQKSRRSMRSKEEQSKQSSHHKHKKSLHLHNLNEQRDAESRRNEAYVSKLLHQLSNKLKQREVKVRRIEARQARQHRRNNNQQ